MKEPQRYVIYARGHRAPDVHNRIYVPVFTDPAIAKAWLESFTGNEIFTRDGNTLLLESGINLKCEQLDQVLRCKDVAELPDQDERRIMRFKYGTWEEQHARPRRIDAITKATPEVVRERRAQRPAGYVTITELCTASGMPAMIARAALRSSGRVKPDYGWAFDPKDIPTIKSICGMK